MVGAADTACASPLSAPPRCMGPGWTSRPCRSCLGHQWLATTSGYIHVRDDHIEQAWANANRRLENPLRLERR